MDQRRNELRQACWQWNYATKIDGSHHYLPICLQMTFWGGYTDDSSSGYSAYALQLEHVYRSMEQYRT